MNLTYKKLDEVCEILDSQRVPITASERKAGQYPYYGANGVQDYVADFIFDDELVLLAEDGGNFGSKERPIAYRVSGKCWVNNHAHVLKPRPEIDVDYLCYALMFYDTTSLVNGATRQKLTQAAMRQMKIPFRSMKEQKTIVQKISAAASLITIRKTQLQKLDQLASSRFIEMFGDPVTNPREWETLSLDKLGELNRGVSKARPRNSPDLLGGIYPLVQTGEVSNSDTYITNFEQTYSEKGLAQSKMWQAGTLCITIAANIAQTAILTFDACFPDSVVGFVANDKTKQLFIHYWFKFFQKILDEQAPQVAQKNINLKILRELQVIVPPKPLQDEFCRFIEQLDKSKVICNKMHKMVEFSLFRV